MLATRAASKPTPARTAHEVTVEDIEYLSHGGSGLLLRLFKPMGAGPFPLMIDLHGGAWCGQDRTSDVLFNEALAKSGVVRALGGPELWRCSGPAQGEAGIGLNFRPRSTICTLDR